MLLAAILSWLFNAISIFSGPPVDFLIGLNSSWCPHPELYARRTFDLSARNTSDASTSQCNSACAADGRSVTDILWSCLAVIFACTWVAVHPGVPKPDQTAWGGLRHRFWLMIYAIIAPELMVLWAVRQWWGARYLADALKGHGFTLTHGFFAQMGGFMLWQNDPSSENPSAPHHRLGVLYPNQIWNLMLGRPCTYGTHRLDPKDVVFTLPTEEDIQDRSKGDALAKALVLGQTTWFIAQCTSRWAQNLRMTELELVTLAFAALNAVVYFLWWDKPLDVRYGVPVVWKKPADVVLAAVDADNDVIMVDADNLSVTDHMDVEKQDDAASNGRRSPLPGKRRSHIHALAHLLHSAVLLLLTPIRVPFNSLKSSINTLRSSFYNSTPAFALSVSPLYSYTDIHTEFRALLLASTIGIGFGAIHLAAWGWNFPTEAEQTIWRVSAVAITATPVVVVIRAAARARGEAYLKKELERRTARMDATLPGTRPEAAVGPRPGNASVQRQHVVDPDAFDPDSPPKHWLLPGRALPRILLWIIVVLTPVYVLARLALLVEALVALRSLAPEAVQEVDWTKFLPHI